MWLEHPIGAAGSRAVSVWMTDARCAAVLVAVLLLLLLEKVYEALCVAALIK